MKSDGRIYVTRSISIDPELLEQIKQRSSELSMNLSEYLCHIARIEVAKKGKPFVVLPVKAKSKNKD